MAEKSLVDMGLADEAWARHLVTTQAGRDITEFLTNFDKSLATAVNPECALAQAFNYRRVFVHAFSANASSFGLPSPTPRVIAILNLSGVKHLCYSNAHSIVRLLCMVDHAGSQHIIKGVKTFLDVVAERDLSVLLAYSLPWQAGVLNAHWELRTLRRIDDGTVVDGDCCFQPSFEAPRMVTGTLQSDASDIRVMDAQIKAFAQQFTASSLDLDSEVEAELSGSHEGGLIATSTTGAAATATGAAVETTSASASPNVAKLHALLSALQADRKLANSEAKHVEEKHREATSKLQRECDERIDAMIDKTKVCREAKDKELRELQSEALKLRKSEKEARQQVQRLTQTHA
ncbi:MAG: hypothetical protein VW891_15690, partial [Novosphingobium sp.]